MRRRGHYDIRIYRAESVWNDNDLHRSVLAAILLSIASIGVSQIPLPESPPIPCPPGQFDCGYSATRIVVYFQGFPIYGFIALSLMFFCIEMAGELKRVIRENAEAEEEISLAP